ncbi:DUF732 domain-containing protein [Actinoplanes sp. NPDC026619]|uniref:DUF732 domain-containing protein n=1 Tax=Actinoplanes sp. NPDC026619 TaxID=3155798 RepID=UPI003401EBEA
MRRTLIAFGLLVALAGCSSPEEEAAPVAAAPASEPVQQATTTQSPLLTHRPEPKRPSRSPQTKKTSPPALDGFLAAVQKQLPQVALDRRDEEVEALGEQACTAIAAGRSATAAAGELSEEGVPAADARKLVALAGATVC